ncbi:hypothetical protein B0T25DRAFT_550166 [Lasiosphaeria hispida]|uniref:Uncharacterized protein n=1 Tax=Lasiosphaeria hispida TaxID=260671 RepID=A0AAJ0HG77_9PEZI|nr:hypothetical protein B0T25DRAFT_550166 [Lasiosphaeria hispida]
MAGPGRSRALTPVQKPARVFLLVGWGGHISCGFGFFSFWWVGTEWSPGGGWVFISCLGALSGAMDLLIKRRLDVVFLWPRYVTSL